MNATTTPIERAASLPLWRDRVEPIPLQGGITNTNFVVEDAGRKFVVRIGSDIDVHGVIRRNELAASRAAFQAGVSPEVIYAEPGALVLAHIEGRTFAPEDARNLGQLVAIVRRCHREIPKYLRGPGFLFWPFHAVRDYAHTLADPRGADHVLLRQLSARAEMLEQAVGPVDLVFGHNDLLAANIIDDGHRLWLVDWDYAGFNSPLFDLGGLASNSDMPEPMCETLLATYFDCPVADELRRRFAAMTAVSLLRETLWSMVSERHSAIDFDHAAYTAANLARFEAAYARFQALET